MAHTVTLIAGDGVGPELAAATKRLFSAAGVSIDWDEQAAGASTEDGVPQAVVDSIRKNRVALKSQLSTPEGHESANVRLRKELNLFAALRPIKSLAGVEARYDDVDLVVIRETTEDVYAGIEHNVIPGVVQTLKVTTEAACTRICRFAFEYAKKHGRKLVTLVHKANIMKQSDGLFIACGKKVAAEYPDIEFKTIIADNACMQLVKWPWQFDVMVAQNLFGDLLSDLGAGLVGGIAPVWGLLRDDTDLHVYEAIHQVSADIAGKGVANPLPMLRPATEMLRHLGENDAYAKISAAIEKTLKDGFKTADLGGEATTDGFVDAVIERL